MRDLPISFVGPMVRATLEDRKMQTRRVVKCAREIVGVGTATDWDRSKAHPQMGTPRIVLIDSHGSPFWLPCPYGQPGDLLWVKETYYAWGIWATRFNAKKGRDEWHFIDMTTACGKSYRYAASMGDPGRRARYASATPEGWKRPAIFMPRVASRILLEVTDVRVQRLNEIRVEDAIAEGIADMREHGIAHVPGLDMKAIGADREARIVGCFSLLWESINGAGSWDANPLVWAISFKRIGAAQ